MSATNCKKCFPLHHYGHLPQSPCVGFEVIGTLQMCVKEIEYTCKKRKKSRGKRNVKKSKMRHLLLTMTVALCKLSGPLIGRGGGGEGRWVCFMRVTKQEIPPVGG